jgi:transcription elongation factor S-II
MYVHVLDTAADKFIPKNWRSKMFTSLYSEAVQRIFWNLHPESPIYNHSLVRRIKEGEFPLENIIKMSSYELCPEKWRHMFDRQLLREQKILEGDKSRSTDQFKCHRCGKRECSFYELQTRSADEPMTQFITCLNCGKRWRQ